MDAREISLVRTTLKTVGAAPGGSGELTKSFYAILFAENPGVRDFFPAAMDTQRDRLVKALMYIVDKLDDPGASVPFLAQLGRDHRKFGVQAEHYHAVGNALLAAMRNFDDLDLWTDDLDSAWRHAIALMTSAMMAGAGAETGPPTWAGTIVAHDRVLSDLAIVRLQLDAPVSDAPMSYEAGQYISVQVANRPRMWRYLSPANPSGPDGLIEFHVRRVSGGWVSPAMVSEAVVGDRWLLGSPLGNLRVDHESDRDVLMIGSGTGVAPLRAQLMQMAPGGYSKRMHLFVGGMYPCDLYDLDSLWRLEDANPWLTVVPVSESETNPWWHQSPVEPSPLGRHRLMIGKIGQVVAEYGSWADHQIQIVGSPAMIHTTKYRLQAAGVSMNLVQHDPLI